MKGIELSEAYYRQCGLQMIDIGFADYRQRVAAGLVGEGSECYGFDDEVSMDHDWGAAFCLWLDAEDYRQIGKELQAAYNSLPDLFMGFKAKTGNRLTTMRTGVLAIPNFYQNLIGLDHIPKTLEEWRGIPEYGLSAATNGRVFQDPLGQFTEFRKGLQVYYPEDIRLKKIAAYCMAMAQTGQYNYLRCIRHCEVLTAEIVLNKFIEATASIVYLLNKVYRPYYKWLLKAMQNLPILGQRIYELSHKFLEHQQLPVEKRVKCNLDLIEFVCSIVIKELQRQGLSDSNSDYLLDHGPLVQRQIVDPYLRRMNVMSE